MLSSFSERGFCKTNRCQASSIKPSCVLRSPKAGRRVGGARVSGEGSGWFVQGSVSRERHRNLSTRVRWEAKVRILCF